MAKDAIKGFPEWLPEQRLVELSFMDTIRRRFELAGFAPMETRAIEPLEVLLEKGEVDKEIYVLRRLHAPEGERDAEQLALHFDLTVPFARYVAQNRGQLAFPMRRYQMQKVWRGEKPQDGRYREFYQCDADVIAENELGVHYDVEMTELLHETVSALPIPPVVIRVNNRKILEGFYRALGVEQIAPVLRVVDKLAKIGPDAVREQLLPMMDARGAELCLRLAHVKGSDRSVLDEVRALGLQHETLAAGLDELAVLLDGTASLPSGAIVADLGIARGLDYYTGIIFEGLMKGYEAKGSVCSGGRYDNLASMGGKAKLPGLGASIGLTRILGLLFGAEQLAASRKTPSCVLVALDSEATRADAFACARALRRRGIPAEVHDKPSKYGKQIAYAERKGIPFVWFPTTAERAHAEVRDIRVGAQTPADVASWSPPAEDLGVRVVTRASV